MANKELIVDDDYCKTMGKYFVSRGAHLEVVISEYIQILESIKQDAIISGDVASALKVYIEYSKKMQNKIRNISNSAKNQTDAFISKIDEADQYLF